MPTKTDENDSTGAEKLENFEQFGKKLFAVPYSEIKDKILKEEDKDPDEIQEPEEPESPNN